MDAIGASLAALQLIVVGVHCWVLLRPRNWRSRPLQVSTLERFSSLDPWGDTPLADWNLELYIVTNHVAALTGARDRVDLDRWLNQPPGPGKRRLRWSESVALRHGPNDEPHFLPRALAKLWLDGVCPTDRLPWLLHDIGPTLKKSDFQFAGVLILFGSFLSGFYGILFAVLLSIYIFVAAPNSHRHRSIEPDVFTSEPQREQTVSLFNDCLIQFHDAVPWPRAMMRIPAGIEGRDRRPYEIGWYEAGASRRLIAVQIPEWNADLYDSTCPTGTVLRTSRVGLTPEFLQQLKARTPGLDVSYITVDGWTWADEAAAGCVGDVWLWLSLLPGIPGFGLFVLVLVFRRREHYLRRRLTRRLAARDRSL